MVALPQTLADKLMAYAYQKGLDRDSRFFDINRSQAWRILKLTAERQGSASLFIHTFCVTPTRLRG